MTTGARQTEAKPPTARRHRRMGIKCRGQGRGRASHIQTVPLIPQQRRTPARKSAGRRNSPLSLQCKRGETACGSERRARQNGGSPQKTGRSKIRPGKREHAPKIEFPRRPPPDWRAPCTSGLAAPFERRSCWGGRRHAPDARARGWVGTKAAAGLGGAGSRPASLQKVFVSSRSVGAKRRCSGAPPRDSQAGRRCEITSQSGQMDGPLKPCSFRGPGAPPDATAAAGGPQAPAPRTVRFKGRRPAAGRPRGGGCGAPWGQAT